MEFVLLLLIGIVLLTIVSGTYLFFAACLRRKELPWQVEEEIKQTPYGKYYDFIVQTTSWLSKHKAVDVYMDSYDGLKLHALWVPAENPRGTVLFAHGYRSTYLVDVGISFEFYHQLGMNLLIPDQRSHGKSEGKYITFGVKESRDFVSWVEYHNSHFGEFPILLDGVSMGASTVLYTADKNLPQNVRGMIADCGFTSPKEIVSAVFRRVTHLPAVPSIWVAEHCARLFGGFSFYECDSRNILKNSKIPVIMAHGTEDDFVPCKMSQEAFSVCGAPKQLLLAEGAGHGLSFLVEKDRYIQMILEFLDKYFGITPEK